jgi:hypothetical protein
MLTAEQTTALQQQFLQQIQQQQHQNVHQQQHQQPLGVQPQDESVQKRRIGMEKIQKQLIDKKRAREEEAVAGGEAKAEVVVVKQQTEADAKWHMMRQALPRLDKSANKHATRIFPVDYCIEFKSPLLIISTSKWELQLEEAQTLFAAALNRTLHHDVIHLSGSQFLITTVKARSYYGRSLDPEKGTGIVVCVFDKCIIIGLYSKPTLATSFIPLVEHFAQEIVALGY